MPKTRCLYVCDIIPNRNDYLDNSDLHYQAIVFLGSFWHARPPRSFGRRLRAVTETVFSTNLAPSAVPADRSGRLVGVSISVSRPGNFPVCKYRELSTYSKAYCDSGTNNSIPCPHLLAIRARFKPMGFGARVLRSTKSADRQFWSVLSINQNYRPESQAAGAKWYRSCIVIGG